MTGPSPYKPRNRAKKSANVSFAQTSTTITKASSSSGETVVKTTLFPLAGLLWPARGSVSQWDVLPLILMTVGLFRWAAGLWGYSG